MGEDSLGVQVLEEGPGLTNWPRALPGRRDPLGLMWARGSVVYPLRSERLYPATPGRLSGQQ